MGKELLSRSGNNKWILHLYVAGQTTKTITALRNLKSMCEKQLKGKYRIELFDILKNPRLGRDNQILAIPTLMRKLPLPVRMIIGDLSNEDQLFSWLNSEQI